MLTQLQVAIEQGLAHVGSHPASMRLAEASSAAAPVSDLLQYGVLGLVVIGFATGWIVPGPQAKALAAENTRLSTLIEGKLFPMLEQYATTMERAAIALERTSEAMDRQALRESGRSSQGSG